MTDDRDRSRWTIQRLLFGREVPIPPTMRNTSYEDHHESYVNELRPEDLDRPELSVRTPRVA